MARIFSISEVARATGVAAKTIRYYEEIGVLPAPSRTVSGYRQYDEPGAQRVRFIRRARALGLPLRHLKPLVVALNGQPRTAVRPRLLALVREELLQRPLAADHERRAGCRCLDVEIARKAALATDAGRDE